MEKTIALLNGIFFFLVVGYYSLYLLNRLLKLVENENVRGIVNVFAFLLLIAIAVCSIFNGQ